MPTKYVVTEFKNGDQGTPIYETMVLQEARDMVLNLIQKPGKPRVLVIIREEGFPSSIQKWV